MAFPFDENLDELAEAIADLVGAFGSHEDSCIAMSGGLLETALCCRVCFTSHLRSRIEAAIRNRKQL